ncbi:Major Facilitator Superfamily protein [Agreia bicolorata]|uniref:Major Facilitator Superfamily protein n=1 Tax=Agreia bicolorata TaxID=110935 RepID=A0A1T4XS35_9MICO|nr:MFS transporter [Agreia bicolorata]SKA91875.1 Major Facilitator Superfamily protein [Agreia bicolorata]
MSQSPPVAAYELTPSGKPKPDRRAVKKAAWAGLIGTTLEQYDFVIYGTASALVFSQLFFPNVSPAAGLIGSFAAYAIGFLARPLGGLFFSKYGDRLGRKWVLVATLSLMGGATFLIGLLPTFEQVGVFAPLLLVLLRFFQGFGAGAEQSGGATLLTETAPTGQRGRFSSLVMVGAALGTALGAVVWILVQMLPEEQVLSWGWRVVFMSSIVVSVAALIIRRRLNESPVFEEVKASQERPVAPVKEVFQSGKLGVGRIILMNFGVSTQSYTIQVYMASYLITIVGTDPKFVPQVLLIGSICGAFAAFFFGTLSDRIGRRRLYSLITGALVLFPAPAFLLLTTGSPVAIILVICIGFILACQGVVGVQMSYFPELFGSRYRYAGVTLGREFSSIIGGGVAPLIATALVTAFSGSWIPVAVYMSVTMIVSLITVRLSPETLNRDLTLEANAARGDSLPTLEEAAVLGATQGIPTIKTGANQL